MFGAVPGQRGEPGQLDEAADGVRTDGIAAGAAGIDDMDADAAEVDRIDVRCEPLVVRDGCSPDRIPAGRWPSDGSLVRSEQFAVNEAIAQRGLFAVHAPPGTGVAEVFGDLVAAIITERARRIADLPSPAAAFGESRTWSTHRVTAPNPALTGFEIVLAAPEPSALTAHGLPPIGAGWREAATAIDYFASTARLSDGVGAWAMLAARLGDGAANRAFAERWWRGAIRGTDVLFPAGESMAAALRRLKQEGPAVDWPTAVARFRAALARAENLASERSGVAAAVTRISDLEQACEEASCLAESAQARLVAATEREPRSARRWPPPRRSTGPGSPTWGRTRSAGRRLRPSRPAARPRCAAPPPCRSPWPAACGGARTGVSGPSPGANCAPPAPLRRRGVMPQRKRRRRLTPPWPRRRQPSRRQRPRSPGLRPRSVRWQRRSRRPGSCGATTFPTGRHKPRPRTPR